MNRLRIYLRLLFFFMISISTVNGQQIFPVQVTGSLLPPNSLSLPDYANGGSTDLMFILTLNDPVEASRLVNFRLTILHNGQEVMMTNPNFNPAPILLEKDVPITIFGPDLAEYLTSNALVNINGDNAGLLLEEGINSICIEVIDVERNIPISVRRCLTGFFENSEPPILNTPECGSTIPWTETQNILFNWVVPPSANNAGIMVEYEFTLTKVLEGQNPNESFQPFQQVLQEITMQPSYQYLEGQSQLEPGATYAWRVRAYDIMGSNLFDNYGYSPVCTFTLNDAFDPSENTTYTCNNGPCDWMGIPSRIPHSKRLVQDDVIQIGHFSMTLTEDPIGDRSGYSGSGTIYIPFLYSKVEVEFDNIKINDNYRVYEGDITTVEPAPGIIPPLFSIENTEQLSNSITDLTSQFSDQTALVLDEHLKPSIQGGPPNLNLVSELKEIAAENRPIVNMPIGLDQIGISNEIPLNIAITGIRFTPENAKLNAVLSTKWNDNEEWIKFGIKSLCLQPSGLAFSGDARLDLLTDVELNLGDFSVNLLGLSDEGDGTFLTWDCNGFQEFNLKGQYEFDDNFENLANPGEPVVATFNASTRDLDDIMAVLEPIDRFSIDGADGFEFEISNVVADLSLKRNNENVVWPDDQEYIDTDSTWMGLFIQSLSLTLPEALQFGEDANSAIEGNNLLIDNNGVSGSIAVTDAINVSTDAFGNWGFTVDELSVDFLRSQFVEANINGGVTLPLVDDAIGYEGLVTIEEDENEEPYYFATLHPSEDIIVGLKLGDPNANAMELSVYNTTNISATYKNGLFQPTAELCGGVAIRINEDDFPSELEDVIAEIKANLPEPVDFNFSADFDMCMGIDPTLSLYDGQYFKLIDYNGSVSLPGIEPIDLSDALSLLQMELDFSVPNPPSVAIPGFPNLPYKIDIPGFPSIDMTSFPDIEVPGFPSFDLSGFPDIEIPGLPTFTLPAFTTIDLPSLPSYPNFDPSLPFIPLGFNFHLPTIPGISLDIGCWAISVPDAPNANLPDVDVPTIPNFDFALFNIDVSIPEFSCSPANPTAFTLPTGTEGDVNVSFLSTDFSVTQGQNTRYYSTAADDAFFEGLSFQALIEQLPDELKEIIQLPAGYENYDLAVTGITFDAEEKNAAINMRLDFDGLIFEGALPIHPKGVNFDGATIALGANTTVTTFGLPGTMNVLGGLDDNGNPLSYIRFDCSGIQGFELSAEYTFPDNYKTISDNEAVTASMQLSAPEWGDFIGTATINEPFSVDELAGFEFTFSNAIVDLDRNRNAEEIVYPENYDVDATWQGFYIESVDIVLPEVLTFSDNQSSIAGRNLLIDDLGISGQAGFKNFLTAGTDNFGGWGLTIDSIGVSITTSELDSAFMDGTILLPLMEDEIGYVGKLKYEDVDNNINTDNSQYVATLGLKDNVTVGLTIGPENESNPLAQITLYKEIEAVDGATEIRAIYDETRDTFMVSATICGGVSIDITEQSFENAGVPTEVLDAAKELVGENIAFHAEFDMCLGMDPSFTLYNGAYFDFEVGTINLGLGDLSVNLDDILNLVEMEFNMPTIGMELPTINMPGFPSLDLSDFPNISFPSMPGFPDFPDIQMPDFPHFNLPDFPDLPSIDLPDPFLPLGFNFDFNLNDIFPGWPSVNLGVGLWTYTPLPIEGFPDFDFASIELNLPSVGFSCLPSNPNLFDLSDNPNSIRVDFLDHEFPVIPVAGSNPQRFKYNAQDGDTFFDGLNLRSALDAMLTSAPVEQVIGEIGTDFSLPVDLAVTGLTFYEEDGLATINTALSITIDGSTYSFAGTLPIDKDGFYVDGIKIGYVGRN